MDPTVPGPLWKRQCVAGAQGGRQAAAEARERWKTARTKHLQECLSEGQKTKDELRVHQERLTYAKDVAAAQEGRRAELNQLWEDLLDWPGQPEPDWGFPDVDWGCSAVAVEPIRRTGWLQSKAATPAAAGNHAHKTPPPATRPENRPEPSMRAVALWNVPQVALEGDCRMMEGLMWALLRSYPGYVSHRTRLLRGDCTLCTVALFAEEHDAHVAAKHLSAWAPASTGGRSQWARVRAVALPGPAEKWWYVNSSGQLPGCWANINNGVLLGCL